MFMFLLVTAAHNDSEYYVFNLVILCLQFGYTMSSIWLYYVFNLVIIVFNLVIIVFNLVIIVFNLVIIRVLLAPAAVPPSDAQYQLIEDYYNYLMNKGVLGPRGTVQQYQTLIFIFFSLV